MKESDNQIIVEIDGRIIIISAVRVTPPRAAKYLQSNTANRTMRARYLKGLATMLESGGFLFNGATIVIDENGILLDGQHRLNAIVRSGVAAWMIIVEGVDPKAMPTVDQGTPRSATDILRWSNERGESELKNLNTVAATTRLAMALLGWSAEECNKQAVAAFAVEHAADLNPAVEIGVSIYKVANRSGFSTAKTSQVHGGQPAATASMLGLFVFYVANEGGSLDLAEEFLRMVIESRPDDRTPTLPQALRRRWVSLVPFNTQANVITRIASELDIAVRMYNYWVACKDMRKAQEPRNLATDWESISAPSTCTERNPKCPS